MPELAFIVHALPGQEPRLVPSTPFDQKPFKNMRLKHGDVIAAEFRKPRNGPHHRKVFGLLKFVFDNQERFDDVEALRYWLTLQTSFVIEWIDRETGEIIRVPRSWKFTEMDELEFCQLHTELVPVILMAFFPSENANWLNAAVDEQAFLDGVASYGD